MPVCVPECECFLHIFTCFFRKQTAIRISRERIQFDDAPKAFDRLVFMLVRHGRDFIFIFRHFIALNAVHRRCTRF